MVEQRAVNSPDEGSSPSLTAICWCCGNLKPVLQFTKSSINQKLYCIHCWVWRHDADNVYNVCTDEYRFANLIRMQASG